jgi:hypothetical protein
MAERQRMTVADLVAQTRDGLLEDFVREALVLVARELMAAEISAETGAELGEIAERVDQTVHIRDGHRQLGVTDQSERINRGHALPERKQDAPVSVARERQPAVGDPQPRRSGGPVEPVRAGNRHAADVGKRCAQPPWAVVGE